MRQEHVTLQDVDVSQLYSQIKKYLQDIKLDIIHEERKEDFLDLKAHKNDGQCYNWKCTDCEGNHNRQ